MIAITIPFKTPSVNHLYGRHGKCTFIKKEGKLLRQQIQVICAEQLADVDLEPYRNCPLQVITRITENWYTKSGTIYRKDIKNRSKFLIDSVFNAIYIEDSHIWNDLMYKEHTDSGECKAVVEISRMDKGGGILI